MKEKKDISLVVITGNSHRHAWFAHYLAQQFDVKGVLFEEKRFPASPSARTQQVLNHIQERDRVEKQYFDKDYSGIFVKLNIKNIERGASNSEEIFDWIKDINPDIIVLFGSSIIRDPLLSFYNNRIINIHLGLSPYYRGTATNFWPLVHNKPECVGATIHLAVASVDAGAILAQARPDIKVNDSVHDIGCKTIIAGAHAMARAIESYVNKETEGTIQTKEQLACGELLKRTDFDEEALKELSAQFEDGMVERYMQDKESRDAKYPIIALD